MACETLFGLYEVELHDCIEVRPECTTMMKKKRYDAIKLYKLVKKNWNGLTVVVADDVIGNLIEGMQFCTD